MIHYVVEAHLGGGYWRVVSRPTESLDTAKEWCDYKNRSNYRHHVVELTLSPFGGTIRRIIHPDTEDNCCGADRLLPGICARGR